MKEIVAVLSPFRAPDQAAKERNIAYARCAVRDSLKRGEVPFASHLIYPQAGILNDDIEEERKRGIEASLGFIKFGADSVAVYEDLGITPGMRQEIDAAAALGVPIVYRKLGGPWDASGKS